FGGLSVPFSGTATDDRSVGAVRIAVMDRTANTWLHSDGTWGAWQQHNAAIASAGAASTSWSDTFNAPQSGLYSLQVEAVDAAGNSSTRASVPFEVRLPDTTGPAVAVGTPTWDQVLTSLSVGASGTATDNKAVTAVRIAVMDRTAG